MKHLITASVALVLSIVFMLPPSATAPPHVEGSAGPPASAVSQPRLPAGVPCVGCWVPGLADDLQWQLTGEIDTSVGVSVYDVDLFETPGPVVQQLHDDGRMVICYLSAGSRENWRPDANDFPAKVLGKPLEGWAGERWLDIRRWKVLGPIMEDRLDLCASKGFDAVEFDNVDAYQNASGFPLTRDDQALYNVRLANAAHAHGLAAGLKNDLGQVKLLEPYFEYALNEECFSYNECDRLTPFIEAGKPVFQVEYEMALDEFCPEATALGFMAQKKRWSLGAWRRPCP